MSVRPEQTPLACIAACANDITCQAISVSSFPYGMSGSCTFFTSPVDADSFGGPFDSPYNQNAGTEYVAVLNRRYVFFFFLE